MKIECPVKRPGGSHIELWGVDYHFQEQPDGAHVAEVSDPKHQDRFLEIGYKIHRPGSKAAEKPALKSVPNKPPQESSLHGSSVHPAEFTIGGKTITLGEVVAAAFKRSGMTTAAWNDQREDVRHERIDDELDLLEAEAGAGTSGEKQDGLGQEPGSDADKDAAAEREKLAAEFQEKFGKKPHHKWSSEKIREELGK